MKTISLRVTDEQSIFLDGKGNKSRYIRDLIKSQMRGEEMEFTIEETVRRIISEMGINAINPEQIIHPPHNNETSENISGVVISLFDI